ncbi:MAG: prolyl oligopeptidase family serine peptidase [Glaciecola sp.]
MSKQLKISAIVASICLVAACNTTNASKTESEMATPYVIKKVTQQTENPTPQVLADIQLSIEQIMSDPDWLGRQPQRARFSPLGDTITYQRKREGSVVNDLYATRAGNGNGEVVPFAQMHALSHSQLITDNDLPFVAWLYEGNVFVQDKTSKVIKQLSKDAYAARNLAFYENTERGISGVSFQRGNSFYIIDVNTGVQSQLFAWQFAEAPKGLTPPADYIADQQQQLIKYVQVQRNNRQARFDYEQQKQGADNTIMATQLYFNKGYETVFASVSPNGNYAIIATREDKPTRSENDIMPDYIEENGRIKSQSVRKRVADAEPESHQLYFVDVNKGSYTPLSYASLPGYNEDVLAQVKQENAKAKGETYTVNRLPRDIGLMYYGYATEPPIKWHDSSTYVALMIEAWDNKDRWIVSVDVNNPALTNQHRLHDSAWVNYRYNQFGWFNDQARLYLLSEESGYSHLYSKALNGKLTPITQGRFVVNDVVLSQDDAKFYYKANVKHPGIYEIYQVSSTGGDATALTDLNGMTDFVLSPNEKELLLTHSSLAMPPELYTLDLNTNAPPTQLTNTVSDAFLSIDWTVPTIVPIASSHTEQPIYSRVYTPSATSTEKQKAVVFTHGAGYLQNAHLGWSGYFREFMFHSFLVSKGYVVLDMDYRASAGYGRDWRTAIYRQMGTPEVEDLKDGVNWLVNNANVDAKRVGTYGGSYGGFLTFMSLFTEPDLFQAGAAIRPVSDWAHYNVPYTSNILNTPDVDPIAYERSSPIYFAEGLTKPLLINAPMVDDNVFFVDVVRLVQRLIELEKPHFETAIYPVEPHGFVQPSSWLDEYRRIFKLFEENL